MAPQRLSASTVLVVAVVATALLAPVLSGVAAAGVAAGHGQATDVQDGTLENTTDDSLNDGSDDDLLNDSDGDLRNDSDGDVSNDSDGDVSNDSDDLDSDVEINDTLDGADGLENDSLVDSSNQLNDTEDSLEGTDGTEDSIETNETIDGVEDTDDVEGDLQNATEEQVDDVSDAVDGETSVGDTTDAVGEEVDDALEDGGDAVEGVENDLQDDGEDVTDGPVSDDATALGETDLLANRTDGYLDDATEAAVAESGLVATVDDRIAAVEAAVDGAGSSTASDARADDSGGSAADDDGEDSVIGALSDPTTPDREQAGAGAALGALALGTGVLARRLGGLGAVAGGGGAGGGLLATAWGLLKAWGWRVGALLGYQRWDDSDPLEHEVRSALHDRIEAAPGATMTELAEATDTPLSTARYHLRILGFEGLVSAEQIRGKRRYFPGYADPDALGPALDDEAVAAVLEAVADEPDSVSGIADRLDRDPSTVTHHLQRLEDEELVERERDGRAVVNRLADDVDPTAVTGVAQGHAD